MDLAANHRQPGQPRWLLATDPVRRPPNKTGGHRQVSAAAVEGAVTRWTYLAGRSLMVAEAFRTFRWRWSAPLAWPATYARHRGMVRQPASRPTVWACWTSAFNL
jgi:hypothetical protein